MKTSWSVAVLVLAAALTTAWPASSAEWIDKAMVTAAETMLSTMPADLYQIEPAAAQH